MDVEGRHVRPHGREIGLVLDVDALDAHRAAARGALGRRADFDDLVDVLGDGTPRARPVCAPRSPAGPPRVRPWISLRKRGRLPLRRAAGRLQLLLEPVTLLLEPIALLPQAVALALQLLPLALEPIALSLALLEVTPQPFVLALEILSRRRPPPPRHRHGGKKAYFDPRIYNAPRRRALTEYNQ
jgi:hypothetical protein